MNHDTWLEQAEIYAVDALDGAELTAFEAHLNGGCPQCEARIREIREAALLLCRNLPPVEPPASLRQAILKTGEKPRYRLQIPAAARIWSHWCGWSLATVAMALITAGSGYMAWLGQRAVRHMEQRVQIIQQQAARHQAAADLLTHPATEVVHLKGLETSPGASARVLWNPVKKEAWLLVSGLPQIPEEKVYELWAITDSGPSPAGLFNVSASGQSLMKVESLADLSRVKTFAVTLEPQGGVEKPTGAMVLAGNRLV